MKFEKDYTRKHKKYEKKAISIIKNIKKDLLKHYESDYSSLILPTDNELVKKIIKFSNTKKEYNNIIVIGIGGSNLGSMAVYDALKNTKKTKKKLYFADTTDPDNLNNILDECKKDKFLAILISKSGRTIESIANYEVILKKIPKKERKKRIIIISDEDSVLTKYAIQKKYENFTIPKKVGGRYSIFSTAGLVPLALAGINIKKLIEGANDSIKKFDKNNIALQGALDLYNNYKKDIKINDLFIFSKDLESVGRWYRQLMGESIGKKYTTKGKISNIGITPTISIGSTDLHSVGQLYLGGPRDKFTSFVNIYKKTEMKIPKNKDSILKYIQGLSFNDISKAILEGTQKAYKKNKLPYNYYLLKEKEEYEVGYFMQTKMLEIMILANLLDINPFDQPNVEEYKKETRKILKK